MGGKRCRFHFVFIRLLNCFFFHPYIKHLHYSLCSKRLYRSRRRFNFLIKNNILPLYIAIITERKVQFHHKESIIIIIIIIIVGSGCCRSRRRDSFALVFLYFLFLSSFFCIFVLRISLVHLFFIYFSISIFASFFFLLFCSSCSVHGITFYNSFFFE